MTRILIAAMLLGLSVGDVDAQRENRNNTFYVFDDAAGLSAADATVTIQQPASGSKWITFHFAQIYCSVDCQVTISRDGTAATTTAMTEQSLNGGETAAATAFSSSNVGAGTVVTEVNLVAGETVTISLAKFFLQDDDSTANNLTIDTDDLTGDVAIYVRWNEN